MNVSSSHSQHSPPASLSGDMIERGTSLMRSSIRQPKSSPSSSFTTSPYFYQEVVDEPEVLWESSVDEILEEAAGGIQEGSTDSNPMGDSPPLSAPDDSAFADAFISFVDSGQVSHNPDWEALVGGTGCVDVLENSTDAQSGSAGIEDDFLFMSQSKDVETGGCKGGVELVNLLVACAHAVSAKSVSMIHCLLDKLGKLASPEGSTTMERVAAYFTEGLACRVANERPDIYKPLPLETDPSLGSACSSEAEEEAVAAFHILNHVSPLVKFAHFSSNDAILQAFRGRERVHVIDLDVGQGLQWPALFQGLASRPEGPPSLVRITGIGPFKDSVQETGDRLAEFAESLGLAFEFHPVVERLDDIRLWMLHVKEGEAVAVNCIGQLHRSMQSREQIQGVLELIRSAKPVVVVLVEQEASHNRESFEGRFAGCLRYYSAVFDALDSSLLHRKSSAARSKVEKTIFAREIRNIVGCEGEERIERHERFEEWTKVMEGGGLRNCGMGKRALVQAKLLLEMFSCDEYKVEALEMNESCERITLAWLDQPLLTVSAWTM